MINLVDKDWLHLSIHCWAGLSSGIRNVLLLRRFPSNGGQYVMFGAKAQNEG